MTKVRYIADSMAEAVTAARRNHGLGVRILHAGARRGDPGRRLSFEVVVEAPAESTSARRSARLALARAVMAARAAADEASATVAAATACPPGAAEAGLARLAARLRAQGFPEELARGVIDRARAAVSACGAGDVGVALREAAISAVAALLPVHRAESGCVGARGGRPFVLAVTGPTGVGKTTTLAKMAAGLRVSRGMKVGLIAGDAFRVGAFEQLRTWARIIDAPVRAADSPGSAADALAALTGCDAVLVDTAGRAPRDTARIGEIAAVLAAIRPDETHVVLPATASGPAQLEAARAFAAVGPTRIVLSKLDEGEQLGPLVAAVRASGVAASWFTTGQEVPDDIEPADARTFAARIVGGAGDDCR